MRSASQSPADILHQYHQMQGVRRSGLETMPDVETPSILLRRIDQHDANPDRVGGGSGLAKRLNQQRRTEPLLYCSSPRVGFSVMRAKWANRVPRWCRERVSSTMRLGSRTITLGVMALAVAGIVVALAPAALAHVPALESSEGEGAAAIGGPEVSRAIYGYLAPDETSDSYVFSVDEPVTQVIGILVPVRGDHEGFRPVLRMLADDTDLTVIEDPGLSERATEWEPFSLTSFWLGGEEQVSFEPGVGYELRVEPGDGPADSGRYVIVFGGPEAFTGADALRTLGYLPVIWFGAYGGAPAHWNWWALIPVAVVVLLIALLTTTVSRRDARART